MARQETFGDRLSDQGCYAKTRGEAFVIDIRTCPKTYSPKTYSAMAYPPETCLKTSPGRRARRMALIVATCLAMAPLASTPSHAAAKIQHLVSPGGIEAWFVQDSTVPLIAMEYAFGGGATQDPADKPGVGNLVASLIDECSGELDSKTFHERLDRRAIELSFTSTRDTFRGSLRMLKDTRDEAFDLLRMALTSPHFDAADVERIRAQIISGLRRDSSNPTAL